MKKIILLSILLNLSFFLSGQKKHRSAFDQELRQHEIKLNLLYLLYPIVAIEYEYMLPRTNTSLGISFARSLDQDPDIKYAFLGNYRLYFAELKGRGLFTEVHAILLRESDETWHEQYNAHGLGVSLGYKASRKGNVMVEVIAGAGKILHKYYGDIEPFYPRVAVNLGYKL